MLLLSTNILSNLVKNLFRSFFFDESFVSLVTIFLNDGVVRACVASEGLTDNIVELLVLWVARVL